MRAGSFCSLLISIFIILKNRKYSRFLGEAVV